MWVRCPGPAVVTPSGPPDRSGRRAARQAPCRDRRAGAGPRRTRIVPCDVHDTRALIRGSPACPRDAVFTTPITCRCRWRWRRTTSGARARLRSALRQEQAADAAPPGPDRAEKSPGTRSRPTGTAAARAALPGGAQAARRGQRDVALVETPGRWRTVRRVLGRYPGAGCWPRSTAGTLRTLETLGTASGCGCSAASGPRCRRCPTSSRNG